MIKVITYGTYDLLHHGHIRLLERAKALGDYLIVGVTADDFDKIRGKINVQQTLIERIENVRKTGLADEIVVEEYEGQKIDDIKRYNVDIFTVGHDWKGKFDYLNEFCDVVYLPRTEGISSSKLREENRSLNLGLVGDTEFLNKIEHEARFVNGLSLAGVCTKRLDLLSENIKKLPLVTDNFEELLNQVDAIYLRTQPVHHYEQIKLALEKQKHVLCEAPMTLSPKEHEELLSLADENNVVLMDAVKTAYATAYDRLLLLVKGGEIGDVVSVDVTCTSLKKFKANLEGNFEYQWDNLHEWGPTALLPVLQVLGTEYLQKRIVTRFIDKERKHDDFTKIDFVYPKAVATIKTGNGVKSEGELVISGTKGYIYVPAPWWKTDYFEIRFEDISDNKRYFYQLDGEGIRYELVAFIRSIETGRDHRNISESVSKAICKIMEDFEEQYDDFITLSV
ncbi:TPA: adenylyltransferase/cytidyltransferase family protein [Streptococcus suis]|nr:adenylyltransferase/cytidyltransferase family protein [Streptococcus suis]